MKTSHMFSTFKNPLKHDKKNKTKRGTESTNLKHLLDAEDRNKITSAQKHVQ